LTAEERSDYDYLDKTHICVRLYLEWNVKRAAEIIRHISFKLDYISYS